MVNFECGRGNIEIIGNGYKIKPKDEYNEIIFFNGPSYDRHKNLKINNLNFTDSEYCALYIENYNMIELNDVSFSYC